MLIPALLLLAVGPPGVVIDHQPASSRQYIGSPSIAILPGGDYVASHDLFGPGSTQSTSAVTRIFRSGDRGQSWRKTAEFNDQFWSNLFVHRGKLYLMGTTCEYGRIVIRRSDDGGVSWSAPSMLTRDAGYHTAPVPVVEHRSRLWRALEFHPEGKWGNFEALAMSAKSNADLMNPKSWTMTARLPYPAAQAPEGKHWLEGNIVRAPSGELVDILRVDNIEKAAIVRLAKSRLQFDTLVDFPGGAKKFTIRYDPKSRAYWTLSNVAPPGSPAPASIRNTLVLMSSPDLRRWSIQRQVLSHPDPEKHAFQYVDWQFDGDDIVAASRTAFDDDEGGAPRAHDANFLTFQRVPNFRETPRHRIIVLLGPPGGGKGTQAEKITAEFGIPSVSTGDLLRAEVRNATPLGRELQSVMQSGKLVSDDIVNKLIAGRLSRDDARAGLILDGYPRTVAQAEFLDRLLAERKLPRPIVLNLEVPDEEIVTRLAARGRPDDKPETVRERLGVYARDTRPVLDYYSPRGLRSIKGTGTPEEVYERVRAAIQSAK